MQTNNTKCVLNGILIQNLGLKIVKTCLLQHSPYMLDSTNINNPHILWWRQFLEGRFTILKEDPSLYSPYLPWSSDLYDNCCHYLGYAMSCLGQHTLHYWSNQTVLLMSSTNTAKGRLSNKGGEDCGMNCEAKSTPYVSKKWSQHKNM